MDLQLYKINISLDPNTSFLLEPVEYYYIESQIRRVLIYQISYTDNITPENNISTRIPYYISDGHTNHFRANIIYPFVCFHDEASKSLCPFDPTHSKLPNGGLIKLYIGKNFNTQIISEAINIQIKKNFDIELFYFMDMVSRHRTIGVMSVLPRIANVLDYFIAITSDAIINLRPNKNYRPVYNSGNEYNMDFVDHQENMTLYGLDPYNLQHSQKFSGFLKITDSYRQILCGMLNNHYNELVSNNIINPERINLRPETISMYEFNTILQTCNGDITNPQPHISSERINSVSNYAQISDLLYSQLFDYTDDIRMPFLSELLLMPPEYIRPFTAILPTNVRQWNAQCYNSEYLKYRQRYIDAKTASQDNEDKSKELLALLANINVKKN